MDKEQVLIETVQHIQEVRFLLSKAITEILDRQQVHDTCKLQPPEVDVFVEYTPKLRDTTYGSDEYRRYLTEMKPALDHHYEVNRHHPEHWPRGIRDMSLIDLLEMICDWKAATMRHADGDIYRSIENNQKRFGYSNELADILRNTADFLMEKRR